MIVAESKPIKEILEMVKDFKKNPLWLDAKVA